jgi:phage gp36-like protein
MTYCTEQEIRDFCGRAFIDAVAANDDGQSVGDIIINANVLAVQEIEAFCAATYAVPFTAYPDTPATVQWLVKIETRWFMSARLPVQSQEYLIAKDLHLDAMAFLKAVRDGKGTIPGATLSGSESNPNEVMTNKATNPIEFTDDLNAGGDSLANWGIKKRQERSWY